MSPLFRRQAVEHQHQKLYGEILLARPLSFTVLVVLFGLIAAALVAFVVCFGFTRKETVPGLLLPDKGVVGITASQGGTVLRRLVENGQAVEAGAPLYVITLAPQGLASGESAQAVIAASLAQRQESLRAELGQQRAQAVQSQDSLRSRRALLVQQVGQIGNEIALAQQQVAIAQSAAGRFEELRSAQYVSEVELQQKQAAVLDQSARVAALRRSQTLVRQDLDAVDKELTASALAAAREATTIERSVSAIDQDRVVNQAQQELTVRATASGVVSALTAQPGQLVAPNQPLGAIVPKGSRLEAEVYAPSRSIGFIKPGTPVLLRYQAFPYQKFGQYRGVVREVSETTLDPAQLPPGLAQPGSAPLYRIRVQLDQQSVQAYGHAQPLRPGMQLEAGLVLESRKVYEWILDPLYSVTGKL